MGEAVHCPRNGESPFLFKSDNSMLQQLQPVPAVYRGTKPLRVQPRTTAAALSRRTVLGVSFIWHVYRMCTCLSGQIVLIWAVVSGSWAATLLVGAVQVAYAVAQAVPAATGVNGTTNTLPTTWQWEWMIMKLPYAQSSSSCFLSSWQHCQPKAAAAAAAVARVTVRCRCWRLA